MEYAACSVIYLDKRAEKDRFEKSAFQSISSDGSSQEVAHPAEPEELQQNVNALLSVFHGVHVCNSGLACLTKARELDTIAGDCLPTLVFLDLEEDASALPKQSLLSTDSPEANDNRSQSFPDVGSPGKADFYGPILLKHFAREITENNLSKLTVLIAFAHPVREATSQSKLEAQRLSKNIEQSGAQDSEDTAEQKPSVITSTRVITYLQAGATDVVQGPFVKERLEALAIHAYRAHIEGHRTQAGFLESRRMRKRSWVGIDEQKPYAYMRESMVSSLMSSICNPEETLVSLQQSKSYYISPDHEDALAKVVGQWGFPAHDFSEEELVHAAFIMLQHALSMPELQRWRIPEAELKAFLMGCRAAYNSFVLYHNFRHVIDVLQAVFYFLVQIGILPPYPLTSSPSLSPKPPSPIAALLRPFDALVLLISAIGHDVGHPGVNNAFLVAMKAPLAQLYNDNSVLEAFHCAAYSQILRRYWKVAFDDMNVRGLLIKSILATDMQLHFKYMLDLGNLQEKLHHNKGTDGWSDKKLDEYKTLACGLLIKCADISNVARPFAIAAKWSDILQREFARQGEMERHVDIPTTLFGGPPELGNTKKLAESQIGFMNIFAHPLFEAVADILPAMQFAVDEIKMNQSVWKLRIQQTKQQDDHQREMDRHTAEGFHSPRSGSPNRMTARSAQNLRSEAGPKQTPGPIGTEQAIPKVPSGIGQTLEASRAPQSPPQAQGQPATESSRRSSSAYPLANIANVGGTEGTGSSAGQKSSGPSNPPGAPPKSLDGTNDLFDRSSPFNETIFSQNAENHAKNAEAGPNSARRGPPSPSRSNRSDNNNAPTSPPMGNFSRPLSYRPAPRVQTSPTRGSGPNNDPASNGTTQRSPTDTKATSFLTEGSDGTADLADAGGADLERPTSGTSSAVTGSAASAGNGVGSGGVMTSPRNGNNGYDGANEVKMNGHGGGGGGGERAVRKRGSKWRLTALFSGRSRKTSDASP